MKIALGGTDDRNYPAGAVRRLFTHAGFGDAEPDSAQVQLGLQGTSGRVSFDISTFRFEPWRPLMVEKNPNRIVGYPPRVSGDIRRRGVMLPTRDPTEDDFRTLRDWGVTLVRFQMVRGWGRTNDNRDIAEYGRWVDGRLDVLERADAHTEGRVGDVIRFACGKRELIVRF